MLERERFVWHSPRGVSAGYRPALHSLMQQLGAEGLQPEPQIGVDGMVTPELKGPEVRRMHYQLEHYMTGAGHAQY